jgi:hypothetical protein
MLKTRRVSAIVLAAIAVWLVVPAGAGAAERDLYYGLAYLRIGAQPQAEQHLTRYRDEERDPVIRQSVDRVLALLKRPLTEEVREYIATTLEESVRARPKTREGSSRPSYFSRMFPVFP